MEVLVILVPLALASGLSVCSGFSGRSKADSTTISKEPPGAPSRMTNLFGRTWSPEGQY